MSEPQAPVTSIFIEFVGALSKNAICPRPEVPQVVDEEISPGPVGQPAQLHLADPGEL
jgi:hypothetical protein